MTTNPNFPCHTENILIPPSEEVFRSDLKSSSLFGLNLSTIKTEKYSDEFYDTKAKDLHAGSLILRVRKANNPKIPQSVEYKGSPFYFAQLLFCRKYGMRFLTKSEAPRSIINCETPSEPLQYLYEDRPDLIGFPLMPSCNVDVKATLRKVKDEDEELPVHIAFHEFKYSFEKKKKLHFVIEIQPFGLRSQSSQDSLIFLSAILGAFLLRGYKSSPVAKYQRICRNDIDT